MTSATARFECGMDLDSVHVGDARLVSHILCISSAEGTDYF